MEGKKNKIIIFFNSVRRRQNKQNIQFFSVVVLVMLLPCWFSVETLFVSYYNTHTNTQNKYAVFDKQFFFCYSIFFIQKHFFLYNFCCFFWQHTIKVLGNKPNTHTHINAYLRYLLLPLQSSSYWLLAL